VVVEGCVVEVCLDRLLIRYHHGMGMVGPLPFVHLFGMTGLTGFVADVCRIVLCEEWSGKQQ